MLTLIPKSFTDAHSDAGVKENFVRNAKRLTTSTDPFWTDLGIIGSNKGYNGESKPYGWLVKEVRKERTKEYQRTNSKDQRNWGYDLFGEKVSNERNCQDIPFFETMRDDLKFHCHCK